jgi:hypothetical protein
MLIGAATVNLSGSDFGPANTRYGPLTARRSYQAAADGIPASFTASNAKIDWDSINSCTKYVSVWSGKPDIAQMASGALDAAVTAFVNTIPVGHRAFLACWHEGDGKVRSGSFTKTQWQDAQVHFAAAVKAAGRVNVHPVIILEAYQPGTGTNYADMWRTDFNGLVDALLIDGYTDNGSEAAVWEKGRLFAESQDIAWGIAEMGCRSTTVDQAWMAKQIRYAMRNGAVMATWFDNTTGGVAATPGTGAGPVGVAQCASIVNQVDPATFTL